MAVEFEHIRVIEEFDRWCKIVNLDVVPEETEFLTVTEALRAHFLIVDSFINKAEGLGGIGPKSVELLESALARQCTGFGGKLQFPDIYSRAAVVLHGMTKNHPFHDANKRTAFLCSMHLLKKNRFIPTITDKQFEDFVVSVADDGIKKLSKYSQFSGEESPEVAFIADYLRKITRPVEKRDYIVTFNELNRILGRFGFKLCDLEGNFIKVRRRADDAYICQVGCPSMSKQVSKSAIKTIRTETQLDALHDIDSAVFFQEAERLDLLLAKYYEPLLRLANR